MLIKDIFEEELPRILHIYEKCYMEKDSDIEAYAAYINTEGFEIDTLNYSCFSIKLAELLPTDETRSTVKEFEQILRSELNTHIDRIKFVKENLITHIESNIYELADAIKNTHDDAYLVIDTDEQTISTYLLPLHEITNEYCVLNTSFYTQDTTKDEIIDDILIDSYQLILQFEKLLS